MNDSFNIQYLYQKEIYKEKWNACIDKAPNGLIYGYSFYLDQMAKHWDGLVLSKGLHSENDYEAVMPLTWNKKYGIHYLYPPFLAAELGVFGKNLNAELIEAFFRSVPKKFKYWDISLNYGNVFDPITIGLKNFKLHKRSNYVLDLNKSYEELYKAFNENIQRNIKKAEQAGCIVQKNFNVEEVIQLALLQMRSYAKGGNENAERFRKLYKYLHENKQAITYGVFSKENKLLSSCVFFFSHNRAYYILVGNHPDARLTGARRNGSSGRAVGQGKVVGTSHAVINGFIKDHAGKKLLLDFEGSDIPGLARFYKSFGAVEEKYAAIKLNRLPFYLKWMK